MVAVIGFVLMLPLAYSAWFTPDEYLRTMNAGRQRLRKRAPWFPETLSYDFYERHPNFDVFIARSRFVGSVRESVVPCWFGLRPLTNALLRAPFGGL